LPLHAPDNESLVFGSEDCYWTQALSLLINVSAFAGTKFKVWKEPLRGTEGAVAMVRYIYGTKGATWVLDVVRDDDTLDWKRTMHKALVVGAAQMVRNDVDIQEWLDEFDQEVEWEAARSASELPLPRRRKMKLLDAMTAGVVQCARWGGGAIFCLA